MRSSFSLALMMLLMPAAGYAQQPATGAQGAAAQPGVAQSATQPPSTLLQPAIDSVAKAGSSVDLNRWKGPTGMRADVDANLVSMQKDIENTLPALLTAADAAPTSASASLPVLLNLDALYSVLLRVTIASRTAAPRDQNQSLEQSATLLDSARRDLGAAILASTIAQEKQTADLQATVQQQASALAAARQAAPLPASDTPAAAKPKKRRTPPKPAPAPTPAPNQ